MIKILNIYKNRLIFINQFVNLTAVSRKTRKASAYIYTITHAYNNIVCVSQCVDLNYMETLQSYGAFMPAQFVIYYLLCHRNEGLLRINIVIIS